MAISSKDFNTLVQEMVAAMQGRAAALIDFSVGSILRALTESVAAQVVWLQGLVLQLLASTRAATSTGADLDSWMADYGLARLPAVAAHGLVTFSRYTVDGTANIPLGTVIQTQDGLQKYIVQADSQNMAFNPTLNAYVMTAGLQSVDVPVQAFVAGTAGNMPAGQINALGQALPGVDTVSNAMDFENGVDAEGDDAFRLRFTQHIASLSKATMTAIDDAISSVPGASSYDVVENLDINGNPAPGSFYVVVDDGSGAPDEVFLGNVAAQVEAVRPLAVTFSVHPPLLTTVDISISVAVSDNYDAPATRAAVQDALRRFVNGLGMGSGLPYTRLIQIAYDASAGVANVSNVVLSGAQIGNSTSDVAGIPKQIIKPGLITVS